MKFVCNLVIGLIMVTNLYGLETGLIVSNGKQIEGNLMEFEVSISATPAVPVEFSYSTRDKTAKAGKNYSKTSGKTILPIGQKKMIIQVPLVASAEKKREELEFELMLTSIKTPIYVSIGVGKIVQDKLNTSFISKESDISKKVNK